MMSQNVRDKNNMNTTVDLFKTKDKPHTALKSLYSALSYLKNHHHVKA